jgi:nucleoside-diphosphate-sugar epimerase
MKVAIVGASGVLGRALIPLLLERHTVRALVRTPERIMRIFGAQVEALECDLLAPDIEERLPDLLAGCNVIIHAATAIPSDFNAPGAWEANTRIRTEGTARLLAATLQSGAEGYIQQSICFAYPDGGEAWITESTPLNPTQTTVLAMEEQVRALPTDRLRWCILRGGVFVGTDTFQDGDIQKLRAGELKVPCDGSAYHPMIHVDDVASAFAAAVERAPSGSIYNISDEPIRQGDYFDKLAAAIGAPKPERDTTVPCPPSQRVSSEAAKAVLGWQPRRGIVP